MVPLEDVDKGMLARHEISGLKQVIQTLIGMELKARDRAISPI